MNTQPGILIIGAGLIGLSTADSLLRRGASVTVMDKRSGPAQGASFCNSGMIHPSQAAPWVSKISSSDLKAVVDLAKLSRGRIVQKSKELGLTMCSRPSGCIQLFKNERDLQSAMRVFQALNIEANKDAVAAENFERPALFFPGDASGNAYEYGKALAQQIFKNGGKFIFNVDKEAIMRASGRADCTIIAAGAESSEVGNWFEVDLPIRPVVGHALNFKLPNMALPDVPVMDNASRSALTVFGDHLRLSGTIDSAAPRDLLQIWSRIAPKLIDMLGVPTYSWSGARPVCDLGRPLIGPTSRPSLWVNAGHGHMGWTLCAGSGDLMALQIMDGYENKDFSVPS